MNLLYTFNPMKGMYITTYEIYNKICISIRNSKGQLRIKHKHMYIDFFIRNLSHISLILISNILSFDHLPRNSCNKIILETH
ncbi:hypothetical protein HanPI659440_Chr10g0376551 [Helianthus annuus]|nr:hypothetical protein HanPI659440_Chr10g0376551 [Helianthus annuus]